MSRPIDLCNLPCYTKPQMKQGRITPNGVVLQAHEAATVVFLTQQGFDVELIPPQRHKGAHTPDIRMLGIEWEIKCPCGRSPHTIKRAFKTALRQSNHLVFDLRQSKLPEAVSLARLSKEFYELRKAKRLLVITKSKKLLDINKHLG